MTHRTRRGVPNPIEQLFVRRPPLHGAVMVLWIAPELSAIGKQSTWTRSRRLVAFRRGSSERNTRYPERGFGTGQFRPSLKAGASLLDGAVRATDPLQNSYRYQ